MGYYTETCANCYSTDSVNYVSILNKHYCWNCMSDIVQEWIDDGGDFTDYLGGNKLVDNNDVEQFFNDIKDLKTKYSFSYDYIFTNEEIKTMKEWMEAIESEWGEITQDKRVSPEDYQLKCKLLNIMKHRGIKEND